MRCIIMMMAIGWQVSIVGLHYSKLSMNSCNKHTSS